MKVDPQDFLHEQYSHLDDKGYGTYRKILLQDARVAYIKACCELDLQNSAEDRNLFTREFNQLLIDLMDATSQSPVEDIVIQTHKAAILASMDPE